MGTRFVLSAVICPICGTENEDVYYAPTCEFITHRCEGCGVDIDLSDYTGITANDVSNADVLVRLTPLRHGEVDMNWQRREALQQLAYAVAWLLIVAACVVLAGLAQVAQ